MSKSWEENSNKEVHSFDDEIFTALLRKGAHEYLENDLLDDLSENKDDAQSELSEATKNKIKRMIRQAIRREKSMRIVKLVPRIAIVVLIFIAICSITVISVEALRVPFLNLFINTKEKITDIEMNEGQTIDEENNISVLFGYIPNGYQFMSEDAQERVTTFIFINENEESIFIKRFSDEGTLGADTENADYDVVMIKENQGFYSVKNGITTLVFTKNEYAYSITASIDLDEIIKIAENIK